MKPGLALLLAFVAAAPAAAQDKTIYSSLPLSGPAKLQAEDVECAMHMALEDSGRTDVRYVSLNDATRRAGGWDPGKVSQNARRAATDATTVAYLGEFNSGASAVSIPILNEAGILQISPSNTYVGLTRADGVRGEPETYYPTGSRTYGRVIPADHTQAQALLALARERGHERVVLLHDGEVYGKSLVRMVRAHAPRHGVSIRFVQTTRRASLASIARRIRSARVGAMIYAGIAQTGAPALWRAVHRRNRRLELIGTDGVANSAFTERIPRSSRARTFITSPTLDPAAHPQAGRDFFARFPQKCGKDAEPYAIYGYEAMALALDALARGGNTRAGAIEAFFATRDRQSVLGTYSIDSNGDTTLAEYGGYRVSRGGRLMFHKVLLARP